MFLLSLIDACCLVLVKASLRACVAGCCHFLWHFFLCLLVCMLSFSAPSPPSRLSSPVLSQIQNERKDNMHSHHRNKPTLEQARVSQRSPSENKASFAADLRSPCHTPFSKNIRQHHVEHHHQTPSISIQHLPQAETEGARSTAINEGSHAATRSTPWTRNSEVCPWPWPLRAEWAPQGNKEENKSDNICLLTFNAVLVRKRFCHFLHFGLYFFQCLMLFNAFLLVAAHFHTCSVSSWPVCDFFCCRSGFSCIVLWRQECAHLRRGCFHSEGLFPHALPCMQRFSAFLHASAFVS